MSRIVGLDPIVHKDDKILILGSMPSVQSLEKQAYYANPTNRFWPMLKEIYGEKENYLLLKQAHIALWDACHSCIRTGSSDASIKEIEPNEVMALLNDHPSISKIICNGKTSFNTVKKFIPELSERIVVCPSTSAANARYRLDDLVKIYRKVLMVDE